MHTAYKRRVRVGIRERPMIWQGQFSLESVKLCSYTLLHHHQESRHTSQLQYYYVVRASDPVQVTSVIWHSDQLSQSVCALGNPAVIRPRQLLCPGAFPWDCRVPGASQGPGSNPAMGPPWHTRQRHFNVQSVGKRVPGAGLDGVERYAVRPVLAYAGCFDIGGRSGEKFCRGRKKTVRLPIARL